MKFPLQGRRRPRSRGASAILGRGGSAKLCEDAFECQGITTSVERGGGLMKVTIPRSDFGECLSFFHREGYVLLLAPGFGQNGQPPVFQLRRLGWPRRLRQRFLAHDNPLEKGTT